MSRLGDLIAMERGRRRLTAKTVAKKNGISEKYLLEVESGKRIIQDDQARRILRSMGMTEHNEVDFSLDEIASTVDLATIQPQSASALEPGAKPVIRVEAAPGEKVDSSIWLDALASVLKAVPVYNAAWRVVSRRMLSIQNGRIEGAAPDKVLYFLSPDDEMAGFRILSGDLVLVVPAEAAIDEAVMLLEWEGQRMLRKIKLLNTSQVLLQSYAHTYHADTVSIADLHFLGRAARIEITLGQ